MWRSVGRGVGKVYWGVGKVREDVGRGVGRSVLACRGGVGKCWGRCVECGEVLGEVWGKCIGVWGRQEKMWGSVLACRGGVGKCWGRCGKVCWVVKGDVGVCEKCGSSVW